MKVSDYLYTSKEQDLLSAVMQMDLTYEGRTIVDDFFFEIDKPTVDDYLELINDLKDYERR